MSSLKTRVSAFDNFQWFAENNHFQLWNFYVRMNWMPAEVIWKSNTVNSAVERNPARRAEVTLLDLFAINCMGWGFLLGIRELGCGRPSSKPQKLIFRQVWNIKEIVCKICRKENPDERPGWWGVKLWKTLPTGGFLLWILQKQTYRQSPSNIIVHRKMLETLYEQFDPWKETSQEIILRVSSMHNLKVSSILYAQPQSIKYVQQHQVSSMSNIIQVSSMHNIIHVCTT